jgi:hypothetical protein
MIASMPCSIVDKKTQEGLHDAAEHIPLRTLQHRLNRLVAAGRLVQEGKRRSARYRIPTSGAAGVAAGLAHVEGSGKGVLPLSNWPGNPEVCPQPARVAEACRIQSRLP